MAWETWLVYLLAVIAICMTPGPNILLAMTHSVQYGLKQTSVTALGCVTATSTMALLSASGLGALLLASETAFIILKWVGGAYLFYLGLTLWIKGGRFNLIAEGSAPKTQKLSKLYLKGLMVSASNPKALIFFGALFPVFLDPNRALIPQFSIMLATFLFFSYGFIMGYAALTSRLAPYLRKERTARWFNRISAMLFMGIGIGLVTSRD